MNLLREDKKEFNRRVLYVLLNERKINPITKCWLFTGSISHKYGRVSIGDNRYQVHRLSAYMCLGLDIENDEIQVLHKLICKNQRCFNPLHLYLGDSYDNNRDTVKAGNHLWASKTECPQGHSYSGDNLYVGPTKKDRRCRICADISREKSRLKLKENKS